MYFLKPVLVIFFIKLSDSGNKISVSEQFAIVESSSYRFQSSISIRFIHLLTTTHISIDYSFRLLYL
jgi:hypothetical protein